MKIRSASYSPIRVACKRSALRLSIHSLVRPFPVSLYPCIPVAVGADGAQWFVVETRGIVIRDENGLVIRKTFAVWSWFGLFCYGISCYFKPLYGISNYIPTHPVGWSVGRWGLRNVRGRDQGWGGKSFNQPASLSATPHYHSLRW